MTNDLKLNKKKILIVGMDDFLGIHLVDALLSEGAHTRVFDDSGANKKIRHWKEHLLSANVELIPHNSPSDVLPAGGIFDAVKDTEVVFHLLGLYPNKPHKSRNGHVIKSRHAKFMETLNVLLACREAGVSRIVQVSRNIAIEEKHLEKSVEGEYLDLTDMNYEQIQYDMEELSRNFHDVYRLPIVTVCAHYAFGPRQENWEIIPALIDQVKSGKKSIHIKGADLVREFTYISDVVQGLLLAGSTPGLEGMKFELSTGQKILHSELANRIVSKLGLDVKVEFDANEKTGARSLAGGEVNAVHKLQGWSPKVPLDEGLNRTIEWMHPAPK